MMATAMPMSSLLGSSVASCASAPVKLDVCTPPAAGVVGGGRGVVELGVGELVDRVGDVDVGGLPVGAERR